MTKRSADPTPLPPTHFEILMSLVDEPLHGYGIVQDVERRTGGELVLATSTLYAALRRLEELGWVSEADGAERSPSPGSSASGGPPRRTYRITDRGRSVADREARRIRRLADHARRRGLGEPPPLAGEPSEAAP